VTVTPDGARAEALALPCREVWWGKRLTAVGVSLAAVQREFLRELLTGAWETKAPPHLRAR
jgi:hypothetical protein